MANTLAISALLLAGALVCRVTSTDVPDKTEDVKVADTDNEDDLETQETGWIVNPIQMKLKELEYLKSKMTSPFMTLRAPARFYGGGGYPTYWTGGGGGFSSSASYNGVIARPQYFWTKPIKTSGPSYAQNTWYNNGLTGIKYQPIVSNYAPDCTYTTTLKPASLFVPSRPTYSSGTPLNFYYSSVTPTQTYGAPSVGFATKSEFNLGSSRIAPSPPLSQTISLSDVTSTAFVAKSAPQFQIPHSSWSSVSSGLPSGTSSSVNSGTLPSSAGFQPSFGSYPSWSSFSGYYPTSSNLPQAPSAISYPPSSSGISGYYPSSAGLPQAPAAISSLPSSSGISGYYPSYSGFSQAPSSSFSGVSGYFPSTGGSYQIPSTPAPPAWSSFTGSSPGSAQISQGPPNSLPSFWSSSSALIPTSPAPASGAQDYYPVSTTPSLPVLNDQGVSITAEEVSITPPPLNVKSNIVTTLQGSNVALSQEPINPGTAYALSYYPNVFYISNEQHLEKPSTETPEEGRSSSQSTSTVPTSLSSERTSTSTESSTVTQSNPLTVKTPVQAAFYPSAVVDQTKIPIAYAFQQPIFPPSRGAAYSSPLVKDAFPVPVASVFGTATFGVAQPTLVQSVPETRTSGSFNVYADGIGYNYQLPPAAFQTGVQSVSSTQAPRLC